MSVHENKCCKCGYDEHVEVLEVHHIDRNRDNSESSNLEVICPTCHEVEHLLAKDGRWKKGSDITNVSTKDVEWPPVDSFADISSKVSKTGYASVAREYGVVTNTIKNYILRGPRG